MKNHDPQMLTKSNLVKMYFQVWENLSLEECWTEPKRLLLQESRSVEVETVLIERVAFNMFLFEGLMTMIY